MDILDQKGDSAFKNYLLYYSVLLVLTIAPSTAIPTTTTAQQSSDFAVTNGKVKVVAGDYSLTGRQILLWGSTQRFFTSQLD